MSSSGSRRREPDGLSGAEYAVLVTILAVALIGTALFVSWAAEKRGLLAPGTVTRATGGGELEQLDADPGAG